MNKTITLLVVRHGKSSHNLGTEEQHTFAGSSIDDGLSPEGINNAHVLCKNILKLALPDIVVSSGLKRSKQTVEIIAKDIRIYRKIDVEVKEIAELNEINVGNFAGHTEQETRSLFPEAAEKFYNGKVDEWDFPKGENYQEVSDRIDIVLKRISELANDRQIVVVVGHGMINRVLFCKLEPNNSELWQTRSYPHNKIVKINYSVKS